MRRSELAGRLAGMAMAYALVSPASGQSFDSSKARDKPERTICASPRLRQADLDLAAAFAAFSARDPSGADAVLAAQPAWLRTRNACTVAADAEACMAKAYAGRTAALAPPQPVAAAVLPVPVAAAAPLPPAQPAAAATPPPEAPPSLPPMTANVPAPPQAAATLEDDRFATAGEHDTLLHVTQPGRFAITARSPSGTALQLVDMITGPGDIAGAAGAHDGRIDALLDIGTYKIRAFGDDAAQGETQLAVAGFADAAPPLLDPGYRGVELSLTDLHQQSFWIVAAKDSVTRIEVLGRSLADLRLWRDGRDLVEIGTQRSVIAPVPAHQLNRILLHATMPPGTYLVTAYGGPPLAWADGSEDQPLLIRTGYSQDLLTGGGTGTIGRFGSEVYAVPKDAAQALLFLPTPADAAVHVFQGTAETGSLSVARNQRAPAGLIGVAGGGSLEMTAKPGTVFNLRGIPRLTGMPARPNFYRADLYGLFALAHGGDEAPAAAILARIDEKGVGTVLASSGVPAIGPNRAWRTRFNLRGPTTLLFQATAVVTAAVTTDGPLVDPMITTLGGAIIDATGDGRAPAQWTLSPDWYVLHLNQEKPSAGVIDLTLGPPGLIPPAPEPPGPPNPVLPLGVQSAPGRDPIRLFRNDVPGNDGGLHTWGVPAKLEDGPVTLTLAAGETQTVQVRVPRAGTLITRDLAARPPIEQRTVSAGDTSVTLSAGDHATTFAVVWLPEPPAPPVPAPAQPPELTVLQDNTPRFLDLNRGEQADFALHLAQGGLFGVTTTGRLHTEGWLGTSFIPNLGVADANGAGSNMLLQRYLRAGRYRLSVAARGSAGHLGIIAAPAVLAEGAPLLPGLSVRASLPAGGGALFPLRVAERGTYRLDLLGLGGSFATRLEDAEGWPLLGDGDLSHLEQDFRAGTYRLILQPPSVPARAVARLRRIVPEAPIQGHGPHVLPFGAEQAAIWREPEAHDAPRTPDTWHFSLAGPADISLRLTGDGITTSLRPDAPDTTPLGRVRDTGTLERTLPAGRYVVEVAAAGRNDFLDYRIALNSQELQPDVPRSVQLPADLPFALAEPRVVSLTSFGNIPLRATLRAEDGSVLASAAERTDDWNIALSRPLPAGRYRLRISALAPPAGSPSDSSDQAASEDSDQGQASGDSGGSSQSDTDTNQPADTASGQDTPDAPPAGQAAMHGSTEITLALAADLPDEALANDGSAIFSGAGVHRVPLPGGTPGSLRIVAAEAPIEITLAVEARAADGTWRRIGQDQSRAPMLAIPEDGAAWRALAWSVDGAGVPIRLATAIAAIPAQALGNMTFSPVPLAGLAARWGAAHLSDPAVATLDVLGSGVPLFAASAPGEAAVRAPVPNPARAARIYPMSNQVWLVAPFPGVTATASAKTAQLPPNGETRLELPAGGKASLPLAANAESSICGFTAAGSSQPGLDAGRGMGVAEGSTFALCGGGPLGIWNAGGNGALRMTLYRHDLALAPEQPADFVFSGTIPPHGALPLRLPPAAKRLDASLAPGGALVAGWTEPGALTVWAANAPLTRSLAGGWTEILLVNTTATAAPAALAILPGETAPSLADNAVISRFFGADGSFVLPVDVQSGQHLRIAGDASATVLSARGQVRHGTDVTLDDGPATAVITHRRGAVALWLEGKGISPWAAAAPREVAMPARVTLADRAMALKLPHAAPALLHLRSTGPLILAFGESQPLLFGQGVTLDRYATGGATTLGLLSPQDGPLSGTLELSATPVTELVEGMGAPVAVGPGGAALFGFRVTMEGPVGLGMRADPDSVSVRLLDDTGRELDRGVTLLHRLAPGHYLLEASVPPNTPTTLLRPTVLGIVPHPTPPPPDLVRSLLIQAGFTPPNAAN